MAIGEPEQDLARIERERGKADIAVPDCRREKRRERRIARRHRQPPKQRARALHVRDLIDPRVQRGVEGEVPRQEGDRGVP